MDATLSEAEYARFRRLLLAALGHLARRGFVVQLEDGLDLIQDFFAEVWAGLRARHDPQRSRFDTYAFAAFVHFARPRIVRLRRWREFLVGPNELRVLIDERFPVDLTPSSALSVAAFDAAIASLPHFQRELLSDYLSTDRTSTRKLSQRHGISRYRTREVLAETLGRVSVLIGEPGRMSEEDWRVATALWQEGRTVDEAAGYLGRTGEQVRRARARLVRLVADSLERSTSPSPRIRRNASMSREIGKFLGDLVASNGRPDLLAELRLRADEVLQFLETEEIRPLQDLFENCDPELVAQIYAALAGGESLTVDDAAIKELLEANSAEEKQIGYAFAEVLLPGLPDHLKAFCSFKKLPSVDEAEKAFLYESVDAQAGGPYSKELIQYGVTPLAVFYAMEAVASATRDFVKDNKNPKTVLLGSREHASPLPHESWIPENTLIAEIGDTVECSEEVATALLAWLIRTAQFKSYIFPGFEAQPFGEAIQLHSSEEITDVYTRWGKSR